MTFKKAYEYAMANSEEFRNHDAYVKEMAKKGEQSSCLFFTVEPGEPSITGSMDVRCRRASTRDAHPTDLSRQTTCSSFCDNTYPAPEVTRAERKGHEKRSGEETVRSEVRHGSDRAGG